MSVIQVRTPNGDIVKVRIAGDTPTEEETNAIRQQFFSQPQKRTASSFQDLLDQESGVTQQEQELEQLFDTETGIKDASLRAALSAAENNKEQENILNKFGLSSIDYTRDKRNRLALTPTGAKKFGVDTDKNVLIDESGFSRYDFADFAGILPELTGAVGGALKGAAVGTAVAPGIGTLLFGALGAGLGGGGGSLAEEAIEGLSGVSDQTATEIAKDAGKEALIAGGAELLFGAPFLLFRSLAPKAGILKEGDSEAVETVKKAVDMEFAPSGRQLGVSPIRAKAESLVESVIGTSPRLRANRIAMNKQVDNYKTKLAEYATKSGGKDAGEVFVNLSNKSLAALNRANASARQSVIQAMKDSSESLAGALKTNSTINDDLYNAFSDVYKTFDEQATAMWKDIDAVLETGLGTKQIIPTDKLIDQRESIIGRIFNTIDGYKTELANNPNSTQNLAYKFLIDSFDPVNMGKKASFSQLYEVRKKLYNILTGDSRNLTPEIVQTINGSDTLTKAFTKALNNVDRILNETNVSKLSEDIITAFGGRNVTKEAQDLLNSLEGGVLSSLNNRVRRILKENDINVTSATTPEEAINSLRAKARASGGEKANLAIQRATSQLKPAREFYKEAMKQYESVAASMGSKSILESIRSGIRPENISGIAMNLIKNNKAQPLLNLKAALKNDDTYNSLKTELGNEWIRSTLRTSGFDSINPRLFKPSEFVKALDDLGETGNELFGAANYTKYKNIAKGFEDVATSEINDELIARAMDAGLDQSIEGILKNSVKVAQDLGEVQKNKVLKKIRDKNLTPDEAAKVVAAPNVTVNELKYITNYLKQNDPQGMDAVRKYYTEQMFDGMGATVNAKTLSDMAKTVKKFDGDFKKLNIVFGEETAQGMRDFGKVLEFISKDVGNSDLVANSITANFMGAIGKIARIGIIGQLFTNRKAIQQIKDLDSATKGLSKQKRGELMASAIGAFVRQFAAQATDSGLESAADQASSFVKNTIDETIQSQNNLNQSVSDLSNQVNQPIENTFQPSMITTPTTNTTTAPLGLIDRVKKQAEELSLRDRASRDPSVANTLLGGLGSAGLL